MTVSGEYLLLLSCLDIHSWLHTFLAAYILGWTEGRVSVCTYCKIYTPGQPTNLSS